MILKKLVLHNYKQHKDLEQDFAGNIIGIVGPNGSGKSNLLGAIHFALAGEQPGFNKSDLLRWGESEGFVELHFEHAKVVCSIRRSLHSAHAVFKYGNEEITGAKKVEEKVMVYLGMDKDLLKQAIFIRQAEIDAILFTDPRIRELSFQRLCGIGDSAKIHKKLGEELTAMALPPNYDEQIAETQLRYKQSKERLVGLQKSLADITATRGKCPSVATLQDEHAGLGRMISLLDNYDRLARKVTQVADELRTAQQEAAAQQAPTTSIADLDGRIAGCQDLEAKVIAYRKVVTEFERAGKSVMDLGGEPEAEPLPYAEEYMLRLAQSAKEARSAYDQYLSQVSMYNTLVKAMQGRLTNGVECPVCGNMITDTSRMLVQLDRYQKLAASCDLTPEQNLITYQSANVDIRRRNDRKQAEYKARRTALVEHYKRAEAALNLAAKADADLGNVQAERLILEEKRRQMISAGQRRAALDTTIQLRQREQSGYVTDLTAINEQLGQSLRDELTNSTFDIVRARLIAKSGTLKDTIQQVTALGEQIAQLSGMVKELEAAVNSLENTIATLEFKRSQQDAYRDALKVLNEVRDWFHYSNGPHTLAQSVLAEMVQDVNLFLDQFSAPFSVVSGGDNLGFKCLFHDGTPAPLDGPPDAAHLSGGQRIQLAVAFRFASYCMFANKLGLLSLDEPTVYLDDYHVGRFCALLEKIKEVAQRMNLQILVATHEASVKQFCDTLIDLHDTQTVKAREEHERATNSSGERGTDKGASAA